MSDTVKAGEAIEDDAVDIPEDERIEAVEDAPSRRGISPTAKVIGIGALLVAVVGAGLFLSSDEVAQSSRMPSTGIIDSTPGGAIQANSQIYSEALSALNERRAQMAEELGITSMPTPEVIMEPIAPIETPSQVTLAPVQDEPRAESAEAPRVTTRRQVPTPAPAPSPVTERRTVRDEAQPVRQTATAPGEEPVNPYIASISSAMGSVSSDQVPLQMATATVNRGDTGASGDTSGRDGRTADAGDGGGTGGDPSAASSGGDDGQAGVLLRPGDILYAETLTSVSSDMASPVLAEVVSGPFRGARLTGSFTADKPSSRMVVEFDNMTMSDGTVASLEAVAVDGRSAETAVASDVERRYLKRYGPTLAASFVSGYASAISRPRQEVLSNDSSDRIVNGQSTEREALLSGVGEAAGMISSDIMSYAPRGPKIILRDGFPIGVLILSPVRIDGRQRASGAPAGGVPGPGRTLSGAPARGMGDGLPEGARFAPVAE